MKRMICRLRDHIYMSAGIYRLAEGFTSFALVHVMFLLFTSLQSVFINTLFIRLTGDSDAVMYYNMVVHIFAGPMMLAASFLGRRTSPTLSLKLGIGLHITMYIVFFASLNNLSDALVLIAALAGTGNGLYWFSYSYLINVYSTDESRDLAISLIGVLGGIVTLTMPPIAGAVIARFTGLWGYGIMFGFSLCMALVAIFLSRKLRSVRLDQRRSQLLPLLKTVAGDKLYGLTLCGEYCKSIREGVFAFFFNILLFEAVSNEALVGFNTLLTGVASIIGAYAYGKMVSGRNRIRSMAFSSTILLALASALFLSLSPVTIILYSALNALLGAFLMNPTFTISYALVLGNRKSRASMPEFIGLRECCISLGRITGILFTMAMPKTVTGYVTAIVVLTALQYVTTALLGYVNRHTPPQSETPAAREAAAQAK